MEPMEPPLDPPLLLLSTSYNFNNENKRNVDLVSKLVEIWFTNLRYFHNLFDFSRLIKIN